MKMTILPIILLFLSCGQNSAFLFDQIIDSGHPREELEAGTLHSVGLHGASGNMFYDKMFAEGKVHNDYLMEKALSDNPTTLIIPNVVSLTEGDIAIMLLLDINFKGSDHEWVQAFVPDHLREEYALHGSRVWWSWVQEKVENRMWVLGRIKSHFLFELL